MRGFVVTGHERGFANARDHEIDEAVLTLADDGDPATLGVAGRNRSPMSM